MQLNTEKPTLKFDDVRGFALLHAQMWLGELLYTADLHCQHP